MLKTLYEFEKENKNNYDDVREYCRAERINEEYFRASAVQKESKHKLVDIIRNILHFGEKEKG